MRWLFALLALALSGCASMPDLGEGGGLPLGKTGWQLSGGADFQKKVWFVCFIRPFGQRENSMAEAWK